MPRTFKPNEIELIRAIVKEEIAEALKKYKPAPILKHVCTKSDEKESKK